MDSPKSHHVDRSLLPSHGSQKSTLYVFVDIIMSTSFFWGFQKIMRQLGWLNFLLPKSSNAKAFCLWIGSLYIPLNYSPMKWICCSPMKWLPLCHFIGTTAVICTHHIHDMVGFHFIIFRLGCTKTFYKLPPFWRNVGIQRRTFIL